MSEQQSRYLDPRREADPFLEVADARKRLAGIPIDLRTKTGGGSRPMIRF
jgi:hypothetical protein